MHVRLGFLFGGLFMNFNQPQNVLHPLEFVNTIFLVAGRVIQCIELMFVR